MGAFSRIHIRLPASWNGEVVAHADIYYGLTQRSCEQLDATAEGSFMSLTPGRAEVIMAKMAENQNWTFNTQTCHESEEVLEELCALSTKMDVLLSRLE